MSGSLVSRGAAPWAMSSRAENAFLGIPALFGGAVPNEGVSSAGDAGGTSRQKFQFAVDMNNLRMVYCNYLISSGAAGDLVAPNPITVTSIIEDQNGNKNTLTFGGRASVCLISGATAQSDPIALSSAIGSLGTVFYSRTLVQIALPPANLTKSTSITGGSLAAATYFYKITTVCGANGEQGESGPAAEFSQATTGATSTITIKGTTDSRSVPPVAWKIYRSTTTNTEVLLATIPAGPGANLAFVDDGSLTPGSATPPAAQQYPLTYNSIAQASQGNNYPANGGGGTNQLTTSGTAWITSTTSLSYGGMLLGTPIQSVPTFGTAPPLSASVGIMGDSIAGGIFVFPGNGWPMQALQGNTPATSWVDLSQSGETLGAITPNAPWAFRFRAQLLNNCSVVLAEYGSNDIFVNNTPLSTMKASYISLWSFLAQLGIPVVQSTILPRTTGSWAAAGNQSLITPNETTRVGINQWFRDGAPVNNATSLAAVAVGANGIRAGQPGHPLVLSPLEFDVCAQVECNNAGALTQDGGRWLANATIAGQGFGGTHPVQFLVTLIIAAITAGSAKLAKYPL